MSSPVLIARPQQSASRVFPPISADLYPGIQDTNEAAIASPEQQAAHYVIGLSQRSLTRAQLWFARNLTPQDQLARLLIQHRLGFASELAAEGQRADFYWQQVQNQLRAWRTQPKIWEALATDLKQRYPEAEILTDPVCLKHRLVEELLIDTHCGFYNGLNTLAPTATGEKADERQPQLSNRAFIHATFLEALLSDSSLERDSWLTLLAIPWQQQITRYRQDQNWRAAIHLCCHQLNLFPQSIPYQTELAEVQGTKIVSSLKKVETEAQALANAQHLQKGIKTFEKLAQTYPHNPAIYEYLGNLHHLHAIQLGNSLQVAEGLVAVEKALIYAPYLEDAHHTRNQLSQTIEQIQNRVMQMQAELRQRRNAQLNAQGLKLQAQAQKGVALRDRFLKSSQAAAAHTAQKLARAMEVWRIIPGLPLAPSEAQAIALYDGLTELIRQPPPDRAALPDEWQRLTQSQSTLAELPAEPICTFLEQRIWEKRVPSPIITPPPVPHDPVVIVPMQTQPQPSFEPFLPWLFSCQHVGLKSQMAMAIAALLTVGGLGLYEWSVRSIRTRTYQALLIAAEQDQPQAMLDNADTFLSQRPLSGKDAREDQVKKLYAQAFVDWFIQQSTLPADDTVQQYTQRYRDLMQD